MYKLCPAEESDVWVVVQWQLTSLRFPEWWTIWHRTFASAAYHAMHTVDEVISTW